MFTINIEKLRLEVIIGILEKERTTPQLVEVECSIGYQKEGDSFLDYVEIVDLIGEMLKNNKYKLIEEALEDIIDKIFKKNLFVKNVRLKISKPNILDNCIVSAELFRKN